MDLKKIRKEFRLTQMDLAQKCKVSLMTIQLWERNITKPNLENQEKLEKILLQLKNKKMWM